MKCAKVYRSCIVLYEDKEDNGKMCVCVNDEMSLKLFLGNEMQAVHGDCLWLTVSSVFLMTKTVLRIIWV